MSVQNDQLINKRNAFFILNKICLFKIQKKLNI
jgi:hypothetical protein